MKRRKNTYVNLHVYLENIRARGHPFLFLTARWTLRGKISYIMHSSLLVDSCSSRIV